MKLDTAEMFIAIDSKDWEAAIAIVANYFTLSDQDFGSYRIEVERFSLKTGRCITIYHKKSGFYCWDQYSGWAADGQWRYTKAGTVVIRMASQSQDFI